MSPESHCYALPYNVAQQVTVSLYYSLKLFVPNSISVTVELLLCLQKKQRQHADVHNFSSVTSLMIYKNDSCSLTCLSCSTIHIHVSGQACSAVSLHVSESERLVLSCLSPFWGLPLRLMLFLLFHKGWWAWLQCLAKGESCSMTEQ